MTKVKSITLKGANGHAGGSSDVFDGDGSACRTLPPTGGRVGLTCQHALFCRLAFVLVVPDGECQPRLLKRRQIPLRRARWRELVAGSGPANWRYPIFDRLLPLPYAVLRQQAASMEAWAGAGHAGGVFGGLFAVLLPYRLGRFALSV